jgi:DNA integrity scanning protein DisA with diadenylate cyclase activity
MDPLISLIIQELQLTSLGQRTFDLTSLNSQLNEVLSKVDSNTLSIITKYLKDDSSIISICIADLQDILKEGKIDINSTVYFLDILKNIYDKVKAIEGTTVTLSAENIIDMCEVILNIILILVAPSELLSPLLQITNIATDMIKFTMTGKNVKFKCCSCF